MTSPDPVKLDGYALIEGPELRVFYKLQNTGWVPIHVWDRLAKPAGDEPVIDDHLAYVCWQDPKTVRVTRAFLRLPEDFNVFMKSEPYVTTLEPGAACEGLIQLPHPVSEYNPYYPATHDIELVHADTVRLVIGWIEHKDDMRLVPREVGGLEVHALRGSWSPPLQRQAAATFPCPVSVLRYKTPFDRRMPLE